MRREEVIGVAVAIVVAVFVEEWAVWIVRRRRKAWVERERRGAAISLGGGEGGWEVSVGVGWVERRRAVQWRRRVV